MSHHIVAIQGKKLLTQYLSLQMTGFDCCHTFSYKEIRFLLCILLLLTHSNCRISHMTMCQSAVMKLRMGEIIDSTNVPWERNGAKTAQICHNHI